jgi:tetratricopeptide (TPR) repeat protein
MNIRLFVLSAAWFSLMIAPVYGQSANDYYRQGVAAMERGEVQAARSAFTKALRVQPDHAYARYQLGQLEGQTENLKAKRRENELAAVRLEKVNFSEVELSEALRALGVMVGDATAGDGEEDDEGRIVNFMIQDSSGKLGDREVSLRMKNVPAKVALDYLLQQVNATARYDEHAIVIRPRGGASR